MRTWIPFSKYKSMKVSILIIICNPLHLKKKYPVFSIRMRISLNYINSDIISLTFIRALTGARLTLTSIFTIKIKQKKYGWLNKITVITIKIFQGTIYLTIILMIFIKRLGVGPRFFFSNQLPNNADAAGSLTHFLNNKVLLRYDLRVIKPSHFKCVVQQFLVSSLSYAAITITQSETICITSIRSLMTIYSSSPSPPQTTINQSTCCFYNLSFLGIRYKWGHTIFKK